MAVSWPWIGVDWRVKNLPLECMVVGGMAVDMAVYIGRVYNGV